MLLSLTARLIAVPEHAWPRLTAACASGEPLPSPMGHAAGVAAISVVATTIGAAMATGASVASVVLVMLLGVVAYVGAAAAAVTFGPKVVIAKGQSASELARFASAAVLPLAASGIFNVVPFALLGLACGLLGAALTAWSAHVGASAMLGLEGPARRSAAAAITAVGLAPVLLGSLLRIVLGR